MYVGGRKGIHERVDKPCRMKRNGSFIDIWFNDDGLDRWIGIAADELRAFLDDPNCQEAEGWVNFDEPANIETLLLEFLRHKLLVDLVRGQH